MNGAVGRPKVTVVELSIGPNPTAANGLTAAVYSEMAKGPGRNREYPSLPEEYGTVAVGIDMSTVLPSLR
ncbi:MAG: hypothetical protein NVSMB9_01300 [Isosphaeraceae bacterium]